NPSLFARGQGVAAASPRHAQDEARYRAEAGAMKKKKNKRALTPSDVSRLLQVNVHQVLAWINSGELRAMNVAKTRNDTRTNKRPRWRIKPDAIADFERSRMNLPMPAPARRPRRRPAGN